MQNKAKTKMTQIKEKETKEEVTIPKLPPRGYTKELAKICKVSTVTVTQAIRYNSPGEKSDLVRKMYKKLYM